MKRQVILVIRDNGQFSAVLRDAGFEVVDLELIETKPLDDLGELHAKLAELSTYDGLFFTSPVAAEIFVDERNGSQDFHGVAYALGRRCRTVLEDSGLDVRFAEQANKADEMLTAFGVSEFVGKRLLFVRGEKSARTIPDSLSATAVVDEVAVYKTGAMAVDETVITEIGGRLAHGDIDWICFFSPSGVERFKELFGGDPGPIRSAAVGTTTADTVRISGFELDYVSPRANAEDFARGLIEHIKTSE